MSPIMPKEYFRVLISATSKAEAARLLKILVENKLIAGGLITNGLSNHWWEGKIDEEIYYNISAFTVSENKDKIIKEVEKIHRDDVPIIAFFKIDYGNEKFLKWVDENTKKTMTNNKYKHIIDSYNQGASAYGASWNVPHEFINIERKKFVELLPKKALVLDIGCGPGMDSAYFHKKGFNVVGIDVSEEMISFAAKKTLQVDFKVMDMRSLDFKDNSMDGIWISYSFLHILEADAKATVAEFRRVLKNGCPIFIAVHTHHKNRFIKTQISGLQNKNGTQLETYIQEWNIDDLVNLINQNNFKIIHKREFKRQGGLYPLFALIAIVNK